MEMEINKEQDGSTLTLTVSGRLNTATAPQLEREIQESLDGITELIFDFGELAYISSAGLRVLLQAQKDMNAKGTMRVRNVGKDVMEVFSITGFSDFLTIE